MNEAGTMVADRKGEQPELGRRRFFQALAATAVAGVAAAPTTTQAQGAGTATGEGVHRTVCTHCSVGCAVEAVVKNGVWIRQEPVFDSPINLGVPLCQKGERARTWPRRVLPQVPEEAGGWQVEAGHLAGGARRGEQPVVEATRAVWPRQRRSGSTPS